ncbi:unnamed protein product [Notodromas monacha]|uniref:Uncharacterized protein n=1 Tax=Notodromas monacha TaxID=399045 RepID=A0A7R9GC19_9CRUS|nr:unnamed protein product [Notodromas monacha]CAG0917014.1 unnamed protein product [Notodromas monacha]
MNIIQVLKTVFAVMSISILLLAGSTNGSPWHYYKYGNRLRYPMQNRRESYYQQNPIHGSRRYPYAIDNSAKKDDTFFVPT